MSTYTQFLYQLVFGNKDHTPFLSLQNRVFIYLALFNTAGVAGSGKRFTMDVTMDIRLADLRSV